MNTQLTTAPVSPGAPTPSGSRCEPTNHQKGSSLSTITGESRGRNIDLDSPLTGMPLVRPSVSPNFDPAFERWNPWRTLVEKYPDYRVITEYELPERYWGLTSVKARRIWICKKLDDRRLTCTLGHELLHLELGLFPQPGTAEHEQAERTIDEVLARRMIPFRALATIMIDRPNATMGIWALLLRVDVPTLTTRLLNLSTVERTALAQVRGGPLPILQIRAEEQRLCVIHEDR